MNLFWGLTLLLTISLGSVSSRWWLLSQYHLPSIGTRVMCDIPGLNRYQRQFCKRFPNIMVSIGDGTKIGINECQFQFRKHRWNCTAIERDSTVFGKKIALSATREIAFIYAITSASVVHSITRWCTHGLLSNCACDPYRHGRERDSNGHFSWGGCSNYLRFGAAFARKFIDYEENNRRDVKALMNLHNNRLGRKAVMKHVRIICKCHGLSGSCLVRTCWRVMMDFRRIGNYLKRKYDSAFMVALNHADNNLITPHVSRNWKGERPSPNDLIYFETSPDFCESNGNSGYYATTGRICKKTSDESDSCDMMCCGRGYHTHKVNITSKCHCKFYWCCKIKCQECHEIRDVHTCRNAKISILI